MGFSVPLPRESQNASSVVSNLEREAQLHLKKLTDFHQMGRTTLIKLKEITRTIHSSEHDALFGF